MQEPEKKGELRHKILSIVGIVLCVILIPILIVNCTMLVKGWVNKDKVPDFAGVMPLIVYTDSMSGIFEMGDLIICKTVDAAEVKKNDIISFFDPAGNGTSVVTHRVIDIVTDEEGNRSFITKGDANNIQDRDPVPAEKLVARYTGISIPNAGHVALFMQTTPGLIVCVFVPLVLLVGYDIIRRKIYEKKHREDKDQLLAELEELRKLKNENTPAEKTQTEDVH